MGNSLLYILTYFVIYSFLGWVLESVVRTVCERKIINTGFLIGPFCPIYGFGAIIMLLFLNTFENNSILLFFIAFVVLSLWEYLVGVLLEKFFSTKYWDYSDHKFNYKGRICLANSIAWGILGVLFIKYIHPFIENIIGYIDSTYLAIATTIIICVILIDAIINIVKVKNIDMQKLPHAFTHGDIISTNVMKDNNGKLWIIDFAVSNYLPRIIDLAVSSCNLCLNPNDTEDTKNKIRMILNEYEKYNKLTSYEKEVFPILFDIANAMGILQLSHLMSKGEISEEDKFWYYESEKGLEFSNNDFWSDIFEKTK